MGSSLRYKTTATAPKGGGVIPSVSVGRRSGIDEKAKTRVDDAAAQTEKDETDD